MEITRKRFGLRFCRSVSAKLTGIKFPRKEKDIADRRKISWNCVKTIESSLSISTLMLHSYIKAFTCSWYVSDTNHPPVNVHVTATYCIRSTPVYWSSLVGSRYESNTYLPISCSRSEYFFRTRSVVTSLMTSRQNYCNSECYYAALRRPVTEQFRIHSFSLW